MRIENKSDTLEGMGFKRTTEDNLIIFTNSCTRIIFDRSNTGYYFQNKCSAGSVETIWKSATWQRSLDSEYIYSKAIHNKLIKLGLRKGER